MLRTTTGLVLGLAGLMMCHSTASAQFPTRLEDLDPTNRNGSLNKSLRNADQERLKIMSNQSRPGRDYSKLYLQNDTDRTVVATIVYLPFNDGKASDLKAHGNGWGQKSITLRPRERVHIGATANVYVYTYATDGTFVWSGTGPAQNVATTTGPKVAGTKTWLIAGRPEEFTMRFTR